MEKQVKKGFTIIEVVLVIAIAGLIFLMVFIALPQMRRTQRDAERKDDVMLFVEGLKKYQSNNRGVLPEGGDQVGVSAEVIWGNGVHNDESWVAFYDQYLGENFTEPSSGEKYDLQIDLCDSSKQGEACNNGIGVGPATVDYTLYVVRQGTCEEDHAVKSANPRDFAVLYRTESSGVYCYNS